LTRLFYAAFTHAGMNILFVKWIESLLHTATKKF